MLKSNFSALPLGDTPMIIHHLLSSDGTHGWHIEGLYNFPPDNHVYEIIEISKTEYDKLKER